MIGERGETVRGRAHKRRTLAVSVRFSTLVVALSGCGARADLDGLGARHGDADASTPGARDAGGLDGRGLPDGNGVPARDGSSHDGSVEGSAGGDGEAQPPSCNPGGQGMAPCGSAGESCCTSLGMPGGTFYRTYDGDQGTLAADGGATGLADPATVSGFRLDKYGVTVGRFRQFVTAWNGEAGSDGGAGYLPPAGSGKHTHLNSGRGLVNVGDDAGVTCRDRLGSVRRPRDRADRRQPLVVPSLLHLDACRRDAREPAHQLRELVGGVCVLHLGRWVSPE